MQPLRDEEADQGGFPAFADAGIRTVVNGPDAYTPDGRCLMGWVPGIVTVRFPPLDE